MNTNNGWLDIDQQRLALWQAIQEIKLGNLHDDKVIIANLHRAGYVIAAAPGSPASTQTTERDWELSCDHCNGSGHVFVERQVAERKSDMQEFKEDCEECDGRGFTIAFQDIPGIAEYVKSCRPASTVANSIHELIRSGDLEALLWKLNGDHEAESARLALYRARQRMLAEGAAVVSLGTNGIEKWKRDSELLEAIQEGCWDVRFLSSPNGDAGDCNIGIEIVAHFMEEPRERVIGEDWDESLRAALEQAMTAEAYPPERPERTASTVADEGAEDERRAFEAWAGNRGWPLSPYQNNCGIVVAERYGHRTVQKAWEAWQERASTGAPAAGDALDAARYRNFRAALCSLDATWLDKVQAALEGMGLDPDDDVLPTADQVDAAFDSASQQGGE